MLVEITSFSAFSSCNFLYSLLLINSLSSFSKLSLFLINPALIPPLSFNLWLKFSFCFILLLRSIIPFLILLILSYVYFIKEKNEVHNYLIIYSIMIVIFFLLVPRPAFGYPRHFLTAAPAFCILVSSFLHKSISKLNRKELIIVFISLILSFSLLIVLKPQLTIYDNAGLIKATNLPDFLFNLFASFPLFLSLLTKRKKLITLSILCALLLSYSIYFDINYSLNKPNTKEAGLYIKENTVQSDTIIAQRSIGYYAERKTIGNGDNKPELIFSYDYLKKYIIMSFSDRQMSSSFFWPKSIEAGIFPPIPPKNEINNAKYTALYYYDSNLKLEKVIGEIYIYSLSK